MVVSSGMQSMETMRRVYETVKEHNKNFCILQCTSAYPLEPEDVNLRIITVKKPALYTLQKKMYFKYSACVSKSDSPWLALSLFLMELYN